MKRIISCLLLLALGFSGVATQVRAYALDRKAKPRKLRQRATPQKAKPLTLAQEIVRDGGAVVDTKRIINDRAEKLPPPVCPAQARKICANAHTGYAEVEVIVDEAGDVIEANFICGHPLLRAAALKAARQAKFPPLLINASQRILAKGIIVYDIVPTR